MADAAVSKTVVSRRASSTLASGTISETDDPANPRGRFIFRRRFDYTANAIHAITQPDKSANTESLLLNEADQMQPAAMSLTLRI